MTNSSQQCGRLELRCYHAFLSALPLSHRRKKLSHISNCIKKGTARRGTGHSIIVRTGSSHERRGIPVPRYAIFLTGVPTNQHFGLTPKHSHVTPLTVTNAMSPTCRRSVIGEPDRANSPVNDTKTPSHRITTHPPPTISPPQAATESTTRPGHQFSQNSNPAISYTNRTYMRPSLPPSRPTR